MDTAVLTIPVTDEFRNQVKKRAAEEGVSVAEGTRALLSMWKEKRVTIRPPIAKTEVVSQGDAA